MHSSRAFAQGDPSASELLATEIKSVDTNAENIPEILEDPLEISLREAFAKKPTQDKGHEQSFDAEIDDTTNGGNTKSLPVFEIIERPDDDLLILSLDLGRVTLFDGLLTYEDLETGKYYIPLVDFLEALEFPIDVDLDQGTASGWFMEESRTFSLDLSKAQAVISGKTFSLSQQEVERHSDGIYVSLEQLQTWFPITLEMNFSDLAVIVKSLEPLPIEVRIARDDRRESGVRSTRRGDKEYPLKETPPPLFSVPFFNTSAQATYDNSEAIEKTFAGSISTLASGIVSGQDFLFSMNDATSDGQGPNIRSSIGLKDPHNNLFGIGGSEYTLGDVNTRSIPLISTGSAGRGFSFSTMPLENSNAAQSGTVQLRGELPVGYQIDAMRNGQLLGFLEEPDQNGEYIFDLDVLPGLNVFELVFYGPQGQKEVREERVFVSSSPVEKGRFGYKAEIVQDDTNLLTNRSTNDEDQGEYRFSTQAEYGLSDTSSLYSAYNDLSLDGVRRRYGLLRYSQSFKGVRADMSYARSNDGGDAASLRFQSVFRGVRWQVQHNYYRSFISEETERASLQGELEHATNLRVSGLLPIFNTIPFSLKLDRLSNKEGIERISWQGRITKNIKKLRVTTSVDQDIEDGRDRETDLNFQVSSRFQNINLRGSLAYEVEPETVFNNISLNADWNINRKTTLRGALRRTGAVDPVHTLTMGVSHVFDFMRLGFSMSYDDDDEIRALLSSSFSLGYDPYKGRTFMEDRRLAQTAMFAPRVYYDKNNNAVYDGSDEWMEGITFSGSGVDRDAETNDEGYALLTGVQPYTRAPFWLETSALPDPFMRSGVPPQDYILRPGQIVVSDFPVILVGEVDGDIRLVKYGTKRGAQSVNVQVLDSEKGELLSEGKSEYDGFAWLENIPMGTHSVRIDPQQASDLGYCVPQSQKITLNPEEPFSSFKSFILWPRGKEGHFNVVLSRQTSRENAEIAWGMITPDIKAVFGEMDVYPNSYIITDHSSDKPEEDQPYMVMLHDLGEQDASKICDAIASRVRVCTVVPSQSVCADSVFEIEQIRRDVMKVAQAN